MFISSTKLNIIYSLIAFGSESKPKPLAAQGDRPRSDLFSRTNGLGLIFLDLTLFLQNDVRSDLFQP